MTSLEDQLARVRVVSAETIGSCALAFRELVEEATGLRVAATHNIADGAPMRDGEGAPLASSVFGFGEGETEWWRAPNLALKSPLPMACRFEAEPFWCNAQGIHTAVPNPFLDLLDLADFEHRALAKAAIVVPVHLPFGQIGAASFLHPDPSVMDLLEPFRSHAAWLGSLSRAFIASYAALFGHCDLRIVSPDLTRREVECLRWAARGKTNDEIGAIIGLTRSTIRFHLRTASGKLDAVNRDQAIFKAAQLGFLGKA